MKRVGELKLQVLYIQTLYVTIKKGPKCHQNCYSKFGYVLTKSKFQHDAKARNLVESDFSMRYGDSLHIKLELHDPES